jgi:hypothetical protein
MPRGPDHGHACSERVDRRSDETNRIFDPRPNTSSPYTNVATWAAAREILTSNCGPSDQTLLGFITCVITCC